MNAKVRIDKLSKELNLDSKQVLAICGQLDIIVKTHRSSITESEAQRIRVAAKKVTAPSLNAKTDPEEWGYILVGSAGDSLIRNFEGDAAVKAYPEYRERREYASGLLFECVGKTCLFYVRRKGSAREPGEEIWELTIATDADKELPTRLKKLGKTLSLIAAVPQDGVGGLKILSAILLQPARGEIDGYAVPCSLRLLPNMQNHLKISKKTLARIAAMPVCGNHVPTEDQLRAWNGFLQIEEKIARARQFCVRYVAQNYGSDSRRIGFEIDITSVTMDGTEENSLEQENFWERAKRARNEDIKLFETTPTAKNWQNGRQIGSIEEIDPQRSLIRIRLERDFADCMVTGRYELPDTGFLFFEAVGDIKQIQRKKKALDDLNNGRTQNPYLGNFLFDASQARPTHKTIQLQPQDLLLSSANPGQKAAVETVLAAKDLVLIQGPPGTGKTTVIAEICYQIALRGGRTLIASQANLAVDNALSRLVHNPVIRAVRKGRAEKVGEEGQAFLEDQVIGTWLENTADDCKNCLSKQVENVKVLRQLLTYLPRFTGYMQVESEFNQQQNEFTKAKATLEANIKKQENLYQENLVQKSEVESLLTKLDNLLSTAPNVNWESEEVTNFLPLLKPYTEGNELVHNFLINVRTAINFTNELNLTHPSYGAFGLGVWLQEVMSTIGEYKIGLNFAKDATVAMSELGLAVQVFQEYSLRLHQLETDYQKILPKQQALQETIQKWENRKQEIDAIIASVKEWKLTAHSQLYSILCQNQTLNELQLPSGLVTLANSLKLPLVPSNYQVNLPDWSILGKAIAYEIDGGFVDRRGNQYTFSYFLQQSFSQVPIIFSANDRAQWQNIGKQFLNYSQLTPNQRRIIVQTTQTCLQKLQHTYAASWESYKHDILNRIAHEFIENILTNARQCVLKVKTETDQQLQYLQKQLNQYQQNEYQQIPTIQAQVEVAEKDANAKLERVMTILQQAQQQLPALHNLIAEYLVKSNIWEYSQEFSTRVSSLENCIIQLGTLIPSLNSFAVLDVIKKSLHEHLVIFKKEIASFTKKLENLQIKLGKLEPPQLSENLIVERQWWENIWQEIPGRLKIDVSTDLFDLNFLHQIQTQFQSWQKQLTEEETYLNRYQHFIQDWIEKVQNPSERDRNDLRRIYLDNANVVGITCVQAASRDFSEEFKHFDVVIIDEVSKCTPPELLIPALKGKKLVMVGDHRQLPPMFDTNTLEEVAQEIGSTREELQFLEESLFKSQFETADKSIKQMLTTQYRMHPMIMGAINQFYDGKLECGILDPDIKRAHHITGIIEENHHLVWVKMPQQEEFAERREGTSFSNIKEIDVIERLCQQIDTAWTSKVANGEPKKEIAVITFYGAQLRKIDERLQSELFPALQIRTGTVDRFQGMERPIVIVSMVRNNSKGDVGFAKKPERVNVAFSRAQELLIIVGCHDLFTHQTGKIGNMYSEVSNVVRLHGGFIDSHIFS
jgi:DNA replication protein DnaC